METNLVILDESGSMYSIRQQAVAGLNDTVGSIRSAQERFPEQKHRLSMVTFSSRHDGNDVRYIFDDVPVAEIGTVDMEQYVPDGGTPLYDAMGTALARLETQCGKDDMVLVTIITDGMENSSHEFSGKSIKIPFFDQIATAYGKNDGVRFSTSAPYSEECKCQILNDDPEIMRMFRRVVETRPSWAVKAMLAKMLEADEVISRLVITPQCKLLLPDYNDMEIRLTPKEKAIYILYLKHPEGISFKNLPDYRDELGRYYRHVTGRDDPKAIEETIDKMVLSISGDADVQRARIKYAINKAFTSQFCDQYARYYTIEGSRGEALKVELPREKVVWEADI